ncbi:ABC transporter ATP-binding protein [Marinitenerispora sediminis]|uniref:Cobalamin/Fe3+-siderophore ABC transporter ATP-binding protein n=1 Tax=Marinitenerispora sediminis TaxID=1931232 RepID=A0A368T2F3_9ACTN|nr:ABC transporter ATP-binding protein [Marinitenerispora sediminis]RCV55005.1 cobalamin/Fe3+-siderophore ABC transporter ATP-binding protein [Marinitenerispora sediminis]RCV56278.1 cobalamin/Fe3+-siderophore ABC transporter ATP-binding protein [Marinitenerispora sediminis]RCV61210.1 cobalamin/Fe3+-siderophore ABC transporter ATP-binding protein [Marinitenerispora sediminis]
MTSEPADPAPSRLRAEGVTLGYGDSVIASGLDFALLDNAVSAIIGPNGCGKSTLLRALGRLLRPGAGQVLLDGRDVAALPPRQVARTVAVLPQSPQAPPGLTVADLVARGRHPHQSWYRQWSSTDHDVVAEALEMTGMLPYAERALEQLSGGQRQRAWISMALAQGTDLLLLDEPTTFLDLAHQVEVLELVRELHERHGRTVLMVLHDLNLAARYAHRLVAMRDGALVAEGTPEAVLTPELLADVFGLDATVIPDPVAGTPLVVPIGLRARAAAAAPADSGAA